MLTDKFVDVIVSKVALLWIHILFSDLTISFKNNFSFSFSFILTYQRLISHTFIFYIKVRSTKQN